uniref:Receptor activity-modifying protein 1 n=1 Tax=Callorhinchus milii TaxID=7868 RepID=A0A4W3HIL4_CALMI
MLPPPVLYLPLLSLAPPLPPSSPTPVAVRPLLLLFIIDYYYYCFPCRCYGDLTNCTFLIAIKLGCFWPNPPVDRFFVNVHKEYFANCSQSGRSLSDPSNHILGPFIVLPVMVTLLITALVVWRSKRNEGIV